MNMIESNGNSNLSEPFWKRKTLEEMSESEWESLCDGCARCCLNKVLEWGTDQVRWTSLSCELLDPQTCRCRNYANREELVSDCVKLSPENLTMTVENKQSTSWLPPTCAYRLLDEGRDLYWWHPLVSGSPDTVHEAGISVMDKVVSEEGITVEDYEDYFVDWPNEALDEEND